MPTSATSATRCSKEYLPVYAEANQVDGKLIAMPAFADAMFLYYRKDLLEKHGLTPPATWNELIAAAKQIQAAEGDPELQGLSFQGKPIEGAVCTFLVPYWGAGGSLTTPDGAFAFDEAAAERSFGLWRQMIADGVAKKNVAEVATDDTRKEFQAGKAVFAMLWAYGWSHFQNDADSAVKDKVGVVRLPAFAGGESATCIGGWQWAVSAFSDAKDEAAKLVRFLAGPEGVRHLALAASNLPVLPGTLRRSRGPGRQSLVRGRQGRGRECARAAEEPALPGGVGDDPHQRERGAGGGEGTQGRDRRDAGAPGPHPAVRRGRDGEVGETTLAVLLLAPALALLGLIVLFPIGRLVWLSFHTLRLSEPWAGQPFVGLLNYRDLWADPRFWGSLATRR